ncbi:hypothetical protein FOMPIDRAFT_1015457 [Fomitopsis schrenkii]|uniref:Uncharacterized protein n=1 Tax=Fomitopsis schrenkii TaxID=2126942 RepID=S8EAT9_FOMSC|nr:hypothetical protein FOMPIDRAFT_1015457 [Fomitopsis schrenkii]
MPVRRQPHTVKVSISRAPLVQEVIQAENEQPIIPHVLFQSPAQRGDLEVTPELIWDAAQLEPYDRLPREFIQTTHFYSPHRPGDWVPPEFHYGWRPNVERLLAFARERGLTMTYADARDDNPPGNDNYPRGLRPRPMYHSYLNDVHVDADGRTVLVPYPATKALWPDADGPEPDPSEIDIYNTISKALNMMVHELAEERGFGEWCHWITDIAVTLREDEGTNFLVSVLVSGGSLTDDMDEPGCRPTREEMDELAQVLGVPGPARWYVDRNVFEWSDQYEEQLLVGGWVVHGDEEADGDEIDEDEGDTDVDDEENMDEII